MATDIGAAMAGDVNGCHAKSVFLSGPDVEMGDEGHADYERCGILVNSSGKRFVDEGSDTQELTNSRVGKLVLAQPGGVAYQIFDAKTVGVLSHHYGLGGYVVADSLETMAESLAAQGLTMDSQALVATIREFNAAVQDGQYDPAVLDGKRTDGLMPDKTNWALRIDTPPFRIYPVTCGITFTFGGLRIDVDARVLDTGGNVIPGLYATGEIAGTYFGYMGGSGITKGHVFGRIAARSAIADMARVG
jgi:tricarballylate dehydrogenase